MRARSFRWTPSVNPPEPAAEYAAATIFASGLGLLLLALLSSALGRSLSPFTWYLARASGMTLYLLLWASVVCGLGLSTTLLDRLGDRALVYSLHAFTTQLSYGFLAMHLISLAADPTAGYGPRDLLVPFAAPWREPWTGFGVLAADLTVIIGASFGVRRLTGYRAWRALHWLTFPLFALALAHGLGSGSDTTTPWAKALYLATGGTVLWLTGYRLRRGPRRPRLAAVQGAPLDRLATPSRRRPTPEKATSSAARS